MRNIIGDHASRDLICGIPTGDVASCSLHFDRPELKGDTLTGRSRGLQGPESKDDPLTARSFRIWSAGDYERISAGFRHEAEAFVARRGMAPGQEVLDAACGTGNLTLPAARTGARVTGLDLVPALLGAAATRAFVEGLDIRFLEGSVEELPFPDGCFDTVLSMFGLMFAARPERAAAELHRVTRPGGTVALANWTRGGFIGRMLSMHAAAVPPPPGVASPLVWGEEGSVRRLLAPERWDVSVTPRTLTFRYPHTPAGTAELFRAEYGPTVRTLAALDEDRRASFAADLASLWARHHQGNGSRTEVDAEYLEVVATRR